MKTKTNTDEQYVSDDMDGIMEEALTKGIGMNKRVKKEEPKTEEELL